MSENGTPNRVALLNPATCGIYKDGRTRYVVDPQSGRRTQEVDNQLGEHVEKYVAELDVPGATYIDVGDIFEKRVLVPRYYDMRWLDDFRQMLAKENLEAVSLGELEDDGILLVRGGHGSPSSDRRTGKSRMSK